MDLIHQKFSPQECWVQLYNYPINKIGPKMRVSK